MNHLGVRLWLLSTAFGTRFVIPFVSHYCDKLFCCSLWIGICVSSIEMDPSESTEGPDGSEVSSQPLQLELEKRTNVPATTEQMEWMEFFKKEREAINKEREEINRKQDDIKKKEDDIKKNQEDSKKQIDSLLKTNKELEKTIREIQVEKKTDRKLDKQKIAEIELRYEKEERTRESKVVASYINSQALFNCVLPEEKIPPMYSRVTWEVLQTRTVFDTLMLQSSDPSESINFVDRCLTNLPANTDSEELKEWIHSVVDVVPQYLVLAKDFGNAFSQWYLHRNQASYPCKKSEADDSAVFSALVNTMLGEAGIITPEAIGDSNVATKRGIVNPYTGRVELRLYTQLCVKGAKRGIQTIKTKQTNHVDFLLLAGGPSTRKAPVGIIECKKKEKLSSPTSQLEAMLQGCGYWSNIWRESGEILGNESITTEESKEALKCLQSMRSCVIWGCTFCEEEFFMDLVFPARRKSSGGGEIHTNATDRDFKEGYSLYPALSYSGNGSDRKFVEFLFTVLVLSFRDRSRVLPSPRYWGQSLCEKERGLAVGIYFVDKTLQVVKVYEDTARSAKYCGYIPQVKIRTWTDQVQVIEYPCVGKVLPQEVRLSAFVAAAEHLKRAHSDGVIHGDIRGMNLVFTRGKEVDEKEEASVDGESSTDEEDSADGESSTYEEDSADGESSTDEEGGANDERSKNYNVAHWIDWDFARHINDEDKYYVDRYQVDLTDAKGHCDGIRHNDVCERNPMKREHDVFSFWHVMDLYKSVDSIEEWPPKELEESTDMESVVSCLKKLDQNLRLRTDPDKVVSEADSTMSSLINASGSSTRKEVKSNPTAITGSTLSAVQHSRPDPSSTSSIPPSGGNPTNSTNMTSSSGRKKRRAGKRSRKGSRKRRKSHKSRT